MHFTRGQLEFLSSWLVRTPSLSKQCSIGIFECSLTCISGSTNIVSPPLPRFLLLLRVLVAVRSLVCGFVVTLLLACALSSYLMAFRADELADNHIGTSINSPQPMIFLVMLTLKLRDRLFEFGHGKIANEFLKHLEDKLVRLSKPDHGRFLEFQSLLHSQLNPG